MSLHAASQHRRPARYGWRALASSPAAVVCAAIGGLTLLAWAALLGEALRGGGSLDAFVGAICRPVALDGLGVWSAAGSFALSAGLWMAMAVAMMLPTAAPLALAYAQIAAERDAQGCESPSPTVLIAGYLSVWLLVALGAALLQTAVAWGWPRLGVPPQAAGVLAGFAIGAAGLYQFSELKLRCLAFCRMPTAALDGRVTPRRADVFRLGLEQGRACLGCCGATMALMLLAGAMNLLWMSLLALLSTVEKLTSGTAAPRLIGVALVLAGMAVAIGAVGVEPVWRALAGR